MMEIWVNTAPITNMTEPMDFISSLEPKEDDSSISGVNFSAFMKEGGIKVKEPVDDEPKKTTRKRKTEYTEIIPQRVSDTGIAEGKRYAQSFSKTTTMLEGAILQTDQLTAEIKGDIDAIRASKSLKSKYTYLTNLTGASASLISTKVGAIKEINNSIMQAHKLELEEMKLSKDIEKDQSDDTRVMELYKAFVNTPVGTYQSPNIPSIAEMTLPGTGGGILPVTMNDDLPASQLTPEQLRMRMESNPNILVVVKFNQSTGQRFFDVIDRTNGASLANYPRPDSFLLDNTTIDVHTMTARNKNIDTVWPLIFIGEGEVTEY